MSLQEVKILLFLIHRYFQKQSQSAETGYNHGLVDGFKFCKVFKGAFFVDDFLQCQCPLVSAVSARHTFAAKLFCAYIGILQQQIQYIPRILGYVIRYCEPSGSCTHKMPL